MSLPLEVVDDIRIINDYARSWEEQEGAQRLKDALERTANSLRNASLRLAAGQALASALVQNLAKCTAELPIEGYSECCAQVGRVVANLVADCDANRELVTGSGYVNKVDLFLRQVSKCEEPTDTVIPIIASILNMVVDGHEASVESVGHWSILQSLLRVAREAVGANGDASTLIEWISESCSKVFEKHSDSLSQNMDATSWKVLTRPLRDFTGEYRQSSVGLKVLRLSATMLEVLSSHDNMDLGALVEHDNGETYIEGMTRFVELGDLPREWNHHSRTDDDGDESFDDCTKAMLEAKEAVIRSLVDLAAHKALQEPAFGPFWTRVKSWLDQRDRPDLLMCALLSFGNSSRDDDRATELVSGPKSILDNVLPLLDPSTEVKVQHALIGLFRNLSIPPGNKDILGVVIEKLVGMRPWSEERDLVGSVQGGAIGVIKNLCRDNVDNSQRFLVTPGPDALLTLMKRTDDQAIRFEATRIFVNIIKSISRAQSSLVQLESDEVIGYLCEMIRLGGRMPVLVNEGVIALSLLGSFGGEGTTSRVAEHLTTLVTSYEGAASALEALRSFMTDTDEATKGIRENCIVLRGVLFEKLPQTAPGKEDIEAWTT